MTIEIVDLPINSMVGFHRFLYVCQRVMMGLIYELHLVFSRYMDSQALEY